MPEVSSFSMDAGLESNPDGTFTWWASAGFNGDSLVDEDGKTDTYQEGFIAIGDALNSKAQQLLEAAQSE